MFELHLSEDLKTFKCPWSDGSTNVIYKAGCGSNTEQKMPFLHLFVIWAILQNRKVCSQNWHQQFPTKQCERYENVE